MNILCIFNYQREVPPFMQMQIGIARKYFDKIYYFTRHMTSNNSETIAYDNVKVVEVSALTRNLMFMGSPVHALFNRYCLTNFLKSRDIKRLKAQATTIFTSDCLYLTAKDTVKKHLKATDNVYMLATWFSTEAYTVARFNKNYNLSKTVSFAHSFEINPNCNDMVPLSFNEFKHTYIDETHFIAQKMKSIYCKAVQTMNIEERFGNKMRITYLGSTKAYDRLNSPSTDGIFRIVSCSGINHIKRLYLIVEALKGWNQGKVEWTHIGDGELFDRLQSQVMELTTYNTNVTVRLLGHKPNSEVQKYYSENPADIFVNVSSLEGLPVSIMEAMSYGIPCLATDVGGTLEIVNAGNGILINKDTTAKRIRDYLQNYCRKKDSEKEVMRHNAFEFWSEHFDANKTLKDFYCSVLD